jgi:hypothetical protein
MESASSLGSVKNVRLLLWELASTHSGADFRLFNIETGGSSIPSVSVFEQVKESLIERSGVTALLDVLSVSTRSVPSWVFLVWSSNDLLVVLDGHVYALIRLGRHEGSN